MITVQGQLAIRTISGRHGDFNVGKLYTSFGEFAVKDAALDQYGEGKYDGQFIITEIKSACYQGAGRLVVEVRASLGGMILDGLDNLTDEETDALEHREHDPIEEESSTAAPSEPVKVDAPPVASAPVLSDSDDLTPFGMGEPTPLAPPVDRSVVSTDELLFGSLWPLGHTVKIDPTVSRQLIRDQCRRLTALGYELDFRSQTWSLVS
ncbi:hypothetical protein ALP05_04384 [Pseudomonas caricapapayae]|uniref:DUF3275 family protein n=1 Tax=Pseudomonas caricapapayae TaxID=46678 RepID=A0A3M6FER7_9PSED|nr:DUF3275 family protein [Pseudomonas caricapapayae]RMV79112.1 hypothetical protein ALP05_04384 [Pseudomonas caricapapayae]